MRATDAILIETRARRDERGRRGGHPLRSPRRRSLCAAVALAVFSSASCVSQVRDLTSFESAGTSVGDVLLSGDWSGLRRQLLLQVRGPSTFVKSTRDAAVLYGDVRCGKWGQLAYTDAPVSCEGGLCQYKLSVALFRWSDGAAIEDLLRSELDAGHELQVRLFLDEDGAIKAQSNWIGFAEHRDALRRSLARAQ